MDGSIGVWVGIGFILVSKIEETPKSGPCFRFTEIGGITMDVKDHVTGVPSDCGIHVFYYF